MNEAKKFFRLFSSCALVKGETDSVLIDLDRKNIYEIPSLLLELLEKTYAFSVEAIKEQYEHEYDEGLDAYLNQLVETDLGFFTNEPEAFPPLNLIWYDPSDIQTAILEIKNLENYNVEKVLKQLNDLGCAAIQFRCLDEISFNDLQQLILWTELSRIRSIELYAMAAAFTSEELLQIVETPRVELLVLHSTDEDANKRLSKEVKTNSKLYFTKQCINEGQQDIVSPDNFVMDIRLFSEAQQHNIALNRKVSIDWQGNIKNHPSHKMSFGNVSTASISEIVKSKVFQNKWHRANDKIEKCKACQYRYVCFFNSDLEERNGKWFKVDDCGFDPFTGEWNTSRR